jgi:hypothetical protein
MPQEGWLRICHPTDNRSQVHRRQRITTSHVVVHVATAFAVFASAAYISLAGSRNGHCFTQ